MSWKKKGGLNYNESKRGVSDYEGNLYNKLVVNDLSVNNIINVDESVGINYPATLLDLSIPKNKQILLSVGGNYKQTGSTLEIFNQESTNNNGATQKHALVHTVDDILQINPNQDYEKSLHIYSSADYPTKIYGNLDISANNVNIYGVTESSRSIEYYTFPVDGQDTDFDLATFDVSNNFSNLVIDGSLNVTNKVYLQDSDISASSLAELYKNSEVKINNITYTNLDTDTMTNEINSNNKEAMAHNELDRLVINGNKDYTGGVHIKGGKYNHNIFLDGNVQIGYCTQTVATEVQYTDENGNVFTSTDYGRQTDNESYNKAFTSGPFPNDVTWVEDNTTNNFSGGYKVDIAGSCRIRGDLLYLDGNLIVEGSKVVLNKETTWTSAEHVLINDTLLVGYPQTIMSGSTSSNLSGPTSQFASADIRGSLVNRNDLFLGDPYSRTNYRFNDYETNTNNGRVYGSIYFANCNNDSLDTIATDSERDIQTLTVNDYKYSGIVKRMLTYGTNYGTELLLYNYKYPQNIQLQNAEQSIYYNTGDRIRLFGGAIRFDTFNTELEPDSTVTNSDGAVEYINHFNDQMYTRMIISGNGNIGIGDKFKTISVNNEPVVKLEIDSTDAIKIPTGTTAQRPTLTGNGFIRFNSDTNKFEGYNGSTHGWETLDGVTNADRTAYITAEENIDQIDFYAPDEVDGVGTIKMKINKEGVEVIGQLISSGPINVGSELGIGIVQPESVFHVKGESPILIVEDTNASETKGQVCFTDNEKAWSMIRGTGTSADGGSLRFHTINSNPTAGINYPFGDPIENDDDLIERMIIDCNGNIGIATSTPQYSLDITNSGEIRTGKIYFNTNDHYVGTMDNQLALFGTNVNGIGFYTADQANNVIGNAKMTIQQNGNIGIGTTSPKACLQTFNDNGLTISPSTSTGERTAVLRLGQPQSENHDAYCSKITSTNNIDNNFNSDLRFYTSIGNNSVASEKMSILSDGNVGIGNVNPEYKLDVDGDIRLTGSLIYEGQIGISDGQGGTSYQANWILDNDNGANYMAGFIGIGTITPFAPLHVKYSSHDGNTQKIGFIIENLEDVNDINTPDYDAAMMLKAKQSGECEIIFNHDDFNRWSLHTEDDVSGNLFVINYNPDVQDFNNNNLSTTKYSKFGFNTDNPLNTYHFYGAGGPTYNEGSISISSLVSNSGGERIASIVLGSHISENNLNYSSKIASYNNPSDSGNQFKSDLRFYTCNSFGSTNEKMRITSVGDIGIGIINPNERLEVDGNIKGSTFITTSDSRHKENICNLENPLDKICSIRGVNFNFKNDKNQKHAGILAQEVDTIIPEAINKKDDDKWCANYSTFVGYLIESVKTLKKENDNQNVKIENLESKLEAQEQLIQKLMEKIDIT